MAFFVGYRFFLAAPDVGGIPEGSEDQTGAQPQSCDIAQIEPVAGGGMGSDAQPATELAGRDTCTVLPEKLELFDGVLCEVIDDIPFMAEDEPANYECSDGNWLVGQPDKIGKLWTIRRVVLSSGSGDPGSRIRGLSTVDIKKAWR